MSLYRFHATIHAQSKFDLHRETVVIRGLSFSRLVLRAEDCQRPFAISFEAAEAALGQLARMFIEPDGSFVWVSTHDESPAWQVDGVLWDRDGRLQFVDLKGTCSAAALDRLLVCFGWPEESLAFQCVRRGWLFDEPTFRQVATLDGASPSV